MNCSFFAPRRDAHALPRRFEHSERLEAVGQTIPLRRIGTPEDCAGATLYLVWRLFPGFVTGEVLEVNGGAHFG